MTLDLLLTEGTVLTPSGRESLAVGIKDGCISYLGSPTEAGPAMTTISLRGLHVLPGVIDSQVHFREPGQPQKEDLESGTRAAILGGVTAICEMPNTEPPTTTTAALREKLDRAVGRAWCDYAFFVGARDDNLDQLGDLERHLGCAGVKIFLGKSTGGLLVDTEEKIRRALSSIRRRAAIHSEDEARLEERKSIAEASVGDPRAHPEWRDAETAWRSTERLLRIATELGRRVHVLHVTTADEIPLLAAAKDVATFEITPQHLTLTAPECYDDLGTLAQMNPPIRTKEHRAALWQAVDQGVVDVIGSDHAPHTLEEKGRPYPQSPSGMTGVQTLLPIMLDHVKAGRLTLERLVDLVCAGPARVHGICSKGRIAVGFDADLTIVDLEAQRRIENSWIASNCGWTPFDGKEVVGWPKMTVLRGQIVMRDDEVLEKPVGRPLRYGETLGTPSA